jgi:hypothetical protein
MVSSFPLESDQNQLKNNAEQIVGSSNRLLWITGWKKDRIGDACGQGYRIGADHRSNKREADDVVIGDGYCDGIGYAVR